MLNELYAIKNTLEQVELKGRANMEKQLACINMLDSLTNRIVQEQQKAKEAETNGSSEDSEA